MQEIFVFDETGKNITYAKPHFATYTIPQNIVNIVDGSVSNYVFIDVAKQSEEFELNFEKDSKLAYIGDYAFYSCSQLTKINFDNATSLQYIGKFAFADCFKLSSLDFTYATKFEGFIGYGAFRRCKSLSSVIFPENSSVKRIYSGTFRHTALTSFRVPKSCTLIDGEAFGYCKIEKFMVEEGNKNYAAYKGSLYNYQKTLLVCYASANPVLELPTETIKIGHLAFEGYPHSLIIPKQIADYDENAFIGFCGASLSIMRPPETINVNLFANCEFKELYFFDTVSAINNGAFEGSVELKYVYFVSPVTTLYEKSFPKVERICFAGEVESVRKCLPSYHIRECKLTFQRNLTCNLGECRSFSNYFPLISIFLIY